jgi:hypothetical protein
MKSKTFALILGLTIGATAHGATYTWKLTDKSRDYYTDPASATHGIKVALQEAKAWFSDPAHHGDQITLLFGPGTYTFITPERVDETPVIDISGINSGVDAQGRAGRLIIRGAGLHDTDLMFTERIDPTAKFQAVDQLEIGGKDASHVSFEGLHLGRAAANAKGPVRSVTQGTVVSVGRENGRYVVIVDIPPGFPTPADVYDTGYFAVHGRFLRRFIYVDGHPQIKDPQEKQEYWEKYQDISSAGHPRRFKLIIGVSRKADTPDARKPPADPPIYQPGDILGMKAKHGQDCAHFTDTSDIVLDHIRWTDCTRTVFLKNSDRISVTNCVTDRGDPIGGIIPCLSSNEGGPQMQKDHATNVYIADNTSEGVGDDAFALFGVDGGTVARNHVSDDYARGINLNGDATYTGIYSKNIACYDNKVERCITIPDVLPDLKPNHPTEPRWVEKGCYWDWTPVLGHP